MTSTEQANSPCPDDEGDGGEFQRLLLYVLLTFVTTWVIIWPAVKDRPAELSEVGWRGIAVVVPSLVAVVMALLDKPEARSAYFRRFVRFPMAWRPVLTLLYGLAALLLVVLFALDPSGVATMLSRPTVLVVLIGLPLFALATQAIGGPLEEAGWRGYALPLMLRLGTPLKASLLLGVIHAAWHLPLFMLTNYPSADHSEIPFVLTLSLFFLHVINVSIGLTWVFLNSRGSIGIAVLAHAVVNFVLAGQNVYEMRLDEGLRFASGFTGTAISSIVSTLMVCVLLALPGPRSQLWRRVVPSSHPGGKVKQST